MNKFLQNYWLSLMLAILSIGLAIWAWQAFTGLGDSLELIQEAYANDAKIASMVTKTFEASLLIPTLTPTNYPPTPSPQPTQPVPTEIPWREYSSEYLMNSDEFFVINPEFNLGGRVELRTENLEILKDYTLEALYKINPEYFIDHSIDNTESLKEYLEVADILPAGLKIEYPKSSFLGLVKLHKPVFLGAIGIEFFHPEDYEKVVLDYSNPKPVLRSKDLIYFYCKSSNNDDWSNTLGLPSPDYQNKLSGAIRVGFGRHDADEYFTITLQVLFLRDEPGLGFPIEKEEYTQSDVDKLDAYLRWLLYSLRAHSYDPPVSILRKNRDRNGNWEGQYGDRLDKYFVSNEIRACNFFQDFILVPDLPGDAPPPILKVKE